MIHPHIRQSAAFSGLTIGLLGGSFNPAHEGHLAMSLYALKQLGVHQIWWMVSPQNPLKKITGMAPLDQRLMRAQSLAAHPRLRVTSIETELGTRYTADTLRCLKKRFPKTRFIWLMGADNLRQIPQWRDWQDIFNLVPIAVFRRPACAGMARVSGYGLGKAAIRFGHNVTKSSYAKTGVKLKTPSWTILDNKLNYTSASKIRKGNPSWQS